MNLKGVLIGCRSFSFPDKQSGELIEGGKLFLAVPSDPSKAASSSGHEISEIPYDYANHSRLSNVVRSNALKSVVVTCDLSITGKRTRIKALDIQPDTKA